MGVAWRIGLAGLWLGFCAANCGAADPPRPEDLDMAIHLVGHEDDELLARVYDLIRDWDPRRLTNPYVETRPVVDEQGQPVLRKVLRRKDLNEFIADVDAAEMLGKAFFWDMQAGSDFHFDKDLNKHIGTACASCHYRFGADARNRHTTRIPFVAWEKYKLDESAHPLVFGETKLPYPVADLAIKDFQQVAPGPQPASLIVGSQGVPSGLLTKIKSTHEAPYANGYWEEWEPRPISPFQHYTPEWGMFLQDQDDSKVHFRQITNRNSPSVINACFSDRLFHDGRAESTFNGFSIFGDYDQREVLYRVDLDGDGEPRPVHVAITDAALASQAVGPIVNDIEMSWTRRTFHHVACKLLDAPVLQHQTIDKADSVLASLAEIPGEKRMKYRQLIQRAFRREWWDDCKHHVDLNLSIRCDETSALPRGSVMHANFSLYWGLSLLIYQSSLVSNESPFDAMMQGDAKPVNELWNRIKSPNFHPIRLDRTSTGTNPPLLVHGSEVFQRGLRLFMNRGCIECHSGPLFSEVYELDRFEDNTLPIAHTMDHVRLPFAQADAIGKQLDDAQLTMLDDLADLIVAQNTGTDPVKARRYALRLAYGMNSLRRLAYGSVSALIRLIESRFPSSGGINIPSSACACRLMQYERTLASLTAGRLFFTEPERVAAAERLADPVLVEQMLIPLNQQATRPSLPFPSIMSQQYAFYDLGFYNLGVSPPRYDRGIGHASQSLSYGAEDLIAAILEYQATKEGQGLLGAVKEADIRKAVSDANLESLGGPEVVAAVQTRIDVVAKIPASLRQSIDGVPGQAYRFQPSFRQSRLIPSEEKLDRNVTTPAAPGTCSVATCNPDATAYDKTFFDTSWSRADLESSRRADRHFLSRARRLVLDEQLWGFRQPLLDDNELAFWGAFKTPSLRNVSLTAPYMHNGRLMDVFEVVDFYQDGGFIPRERDHNPDKHPAIRGFDLTADDRRALVFFLYSLTDPRVEYERAPFDHPSLELVNGYEQIGSGYRERVVSLTAVGADGTTVPPSTFPSEK